jgi:K+-transporting ATPase KdpF subunit
MIFDYSLAGLVAAGLLGYLFYALLRPERILAPKEPALGFGSANMVAAGAHDDQNLVAMTNELVTGTSDIGTSRR